MSEIVSVVLLKKCPFCGKEAKYEQLRDHHGDYINLGCSDRQCIAHNILYTITLDDMPFKKAIELWNHRKEAQELGQKNAKLIDALGKIASCFPWHDEENAKVCVEIAKEALKEVEDE